MPRDFVVSSLAVREAVVQGDAWCGRGSFGLACRLRIRDALRYEEDGEVAEGGGGTRGLALDGGRGDDDLPQDARLHASHAAGPAVLRCPRPPRGPARSARGPPHRVHRRGPQGQGALCRRAAAMSRARSPRGPLSDLERLRCIMDCTDLFDLTVMCPLSRCVRPFFG
jgi:hypothetical protein